MQEQIFTITAFQRVIQSNIKGLPDIGDHRCVGFYPNYFEAENAVLENFNNIYDNMYEYVIIEKIEPGVKLHDLGRTLFKWNGSKYEKTQIPELLKELSNFGIG